MNVQAVYQKLEPHIMGAVEQAAGRVVDSAAPSDPTAGMCWWDTARMREYAWNGTRWLSTEELPIALTARTLSPFSVACTVGDAPIRPNAFFSSICARMFVSGVGDVNNFWTIALATHTALAPARYVWYHDAKQAGGSGVLVEATPNMAANSGEQMVYLDVWKTGNPGILYLSFAGGYRLIG